MNINDQIDWFARRPPSHLMGLVSNDCPELNMGVGGHGEEIAIGFRLKCKCGSQSFSVSAYRWRRKPDSPEALISPILASCHDCGTSLLVFDSDQHGYDPVACGTSSLARGEREQGATEQKVSSGAPHAIDIVAYYPDDLFEADFEEFADRRSDLFTWLRIIVGENTDPDYPLLDFECA